MRDHFAWWSSNKHRVPEPEIEWDVAPPKASSVSSAVSPDPGFKRQRLDDPPELLPTDAKAGQQTKNESLKADTAVIAELQTELRRAIAGLKEATDTLRQDRQAATAVNRADRYLTASMAST